MSEKIQVIQDGKNVLIKENKKEFNDVLINKLNINCVLKMLKKRDKILANPTHFKDELKELTCLKNIRYNYENKLNKKYVAHNSGIVFEKLEDGTLKYIKQVVDGEGYLSVSIDMLFFNVHRIISLTFDA